MHSLKRASTVLSVVVLSALFGLSACVPMVPERTTTVPSVDVSRYLGTWYEVASVKQFFSIGLVGSTANYSLNPDGSIRVFNSGNYFAFDGPASTIVGSAVPVDASNARLNVSFTGSNSKQGQGNYWIVDLDPDYQWAIVSDPSGESCFLLSRTRQITPELRADLLARAAAKGVNITNVTETLQPAA
ncbi:MAG: lipocalin family protein [Acidimicrobiales bacterium]